MTPQNETPETFSLVEKVAAKRPDEGRAEPGAALNLASPSPLTPSPPGGGGSGSWAPTSATRQKQFPRANGRAKRMRKEMTPSEKKLWALLRDVEGFTFRRQLALGQYVFDFGEYSTRLLIEIDGSIHRLADVQENDRAKEVHAVALGFRVMRFANNDVWDRPHWVLTQVRAFLDAPHPPAPSPPGGGGEER